jgi:hypothetical protein
MSPEASWTEAQWLAHFRRPLSDPVDLRSATTATVPDWLVPRPEAVPTALQASGWVLWRAAPNSEKPAKPTKVPYQIADPVRKASTTDATTWGTFQDAVDAYALLGPPHRDPDPRLGPLVGIGAVLTVEAGIVCVDLDRVLDGTTLDPRAARVVAQFASWTEISPSGTGLHIFARGALSESLKGDQLEIYSAGRFIAVTGHQWPGTPDQLVARQPLLDHFMALAAAKQPPVHPYTGARQPPPDDLGGALLAKAQALGLVASGPLRRWTDGYLLELRTCPWASAHTSGSGGAAVMIRASGAYDFTCLHAHCADRGWRDLRAVTDSR